MLFYKVFIGYGHDGILLSDGFRPGGLGSRRKRLCIEGEIGGTLRPGLFCAGGRAGRSSVFSGPSFGLLWRNAAGSSGITAAGTGKGRGFRR